MFIRPYEAWPAEIHGVAKSWKRLSEWTELNWRCRWSPSYFSLSLPSSWIFKEAKDYLQCLSAGRKLLCLQVDKQMDKKSTLREILLVLWQIRTSQHSPAPTALLFLFFFSIFFFMISLEPEIYFTRLWRGCRMGKGKDHINSAIFFFVSAIETAWEFGQETPWMLQGTSREHFASQS